MKISIKGYCLSPEPTYMDITMEIRQVQMKPSRRHHTFDLILTDAEGYQTDLTMDATTTINVQE